MSTVKAPATSSPITIIGTVSYHISTEQSPIFAQPDKESLQNNIKVEERKEEIKEAL